jgi:hypothetical protein
VRALHDRLGAVQQYPPLAAEKAEEDVEHVHQLRVRTRGATAALRLYEQVIPSRRLRWLKKQLRRIRPAADYARDSDALIQRLKQKAPSRGTRRWLKAALAERAEAQGAIVAVHHRLRRDDRFARRVGKLLERVASHGEEARPQAPELNPGEYLNNDLKGQVNAERLPDTKQELESNFQRFMNKLEELPAHVKSYFQHPKVQYAAATTT